MDSMMHMMLKTVKNDPNLLLKQIWSLICAVTLYIKEKMYKHFSGISNKNELHY